MLQSPLRAKALIRDIPDFPKKGIIFKDITPVLRDVAAMAEILEHFDDVVRPLRVDAVVGIESRGFLLGTPLAVRLGVGFVPIRKVGKLPHKTIEEHYDLEYGTNTLQIHSDAILPGERVLIIDDLLATGGTARASVKLVERLGGEVVSLAFLIELAFLHGRDSFDGRNIISLIEY